MKLRCQRNDLNQGVQVASRAVQSKSTLPILSNVLLEASGEELRVTGTDLDIRVRTTVPATIEEEGTVTVDGKLFAEVAANFTAAEVELRLEDNLLKASAGVSDYDMRTLPADEYPVLPDIEVDQVLSLGEGTLRRLISLTTFACAQEETRAIMSGVLLELEGETLRMVATDTHRLSLAESALPESAEVDTSAIVPGRAFAALERVLADDDEPRAELSLGENQVQVATKSVVMVARLIDGQFPNYRRVIPADHEKRLIVDRESLAQAVHNVRAVAQRDANKIILETTGEVLSLRAESQEVGKGYEEVPVKLEGDEVQIAFNGQYLEDVLRIVEADTMVLDLSGSLNPGIIRMQGEDSFLYVLMPMQLT